MTMTPHNQLVEDLMAARALIDTPEKWRKDDSWGHENCCAIVATTRVTNPGSEQHLFDREVTAWWALYEALPGEWKPTGDEEEHPGISVGEFNDHPDTTHADIMALYDRAIATAEAKS